MNTKKFAREMMGKLVEVAAEMRRVCNFASSHIEVGKSWVSTPIRIRTGWVVGVRTIYDGTIEPGSYEEPTHFEPTAQHRVLLVAYWPTMRPVCVRAKDLREARGTVPQPPMSSERDRKEMSEWMRGNPTPRGKGGRFVRARK